MIENLDGGGVRTFAPKSSSENKRVRALHRLRVQLASGLKHVRYADFAGVMKTRTEPLTARDIQRIQKEINTLSKRI